MLFRTHCRIFTYTLEGAYTIALRSRVRSCSPYTQHIFESLISDQAQSICRNYFKSTCGPAFKESRGAFLQEACGCCHGARHPVRYAQQSSLNTGHIQPRNSRQEVQCKVHAMLSCACFPVTRHKELANDWGYRAPYRHKSMRLTVVRAARHLHPPADRVQWIAHSCGHRASNCPQP